jgi:hypothetical protein
MAKWLPQSNYFYSISEVWKDRIKSHIKETYRFQGKLKPYFLNYVRLPQYRNMKMIYHRHRIKIL